MNKVFEYKIIKVDLLKSFFSTGNIKCNELEIEFSDLGKDGWELVSFLDTSKLGGHIKYYTAVFKREKK